jgi:RimJ/RimL family protein N-acetyltransferase
VALEPLSLDCIADLTRAASGPRETYALTGVPNGEAATREYVEAALALAARGEVLPFATRSLESGRLVGSTRFGNIERWRWSSPFREKDRPPSLPDAVEIGWTWLAADAQRTGINTEAKVLMLTHAFETWRVHRVALRTDERNARSRAAIERIGAKLEGILRNHMPAYDGIVRSTATYSLIAEEWPEAKARLEERLRVR